MTHVDLESDGYNKGLEREGRDTVCECRECR